MNKPDRPNADEYFLKIASVVAERATCHRHHVGAIAVRDKRILTTGYNGAPTGLKDCLELGCLRDELGIPSGQRHEICRAVHAEQNAIIQAALHGVSLEGATIYATHTPCVLCAKMLVNTRIARFVSFGTYNDDSFTELFREANIQFESRLGPPQVQHKGEKTTPEQKAAYINSKVVAMQAEIAGMEAENAWRVSCGNSIAYGYDAFMSLRDKYGLGENDIWNKRGKRG